jgi:uncharacterized membrane protein YqjE
MSDAGVRRETDPADKPVGELVADMTSQVTALLRKEVEMAVVELRDEMKQAAKAGGMLGGAALNGYFALVFASFAVAWLLDRKLPRPLAFGLVAFMHGAAAATLLKLGHDEMKQVDPVPTQTVETLKENIDWAKAQTS